MDREVSRPHTRRQPRRLTPEKLLGLEGLTPREAQVALMAGRGLRISAIAEELTVAPSTVKTLLARARGKLACQNVRELTAFLLCEGLIRPDELVGPGEGHPHRA